MIGQKFESYENGVLFDTVTLIAFDQGRAIVRMSNGFLVDINLRSLRQIEPTHDQRLKDAEEVIAFYADMTIYEESSNDGEQVKNLTLPDCEAEWMDGGDMKANYWGGKRARDYLKKYSEDK